MGRWTSAFSARWLEVAMRALDLFAITRLALRRLQNLSPLLAWIRDEFYVRSREHGGSKTRSTSTSLTWGTLASLYLTSETRTGPMPHRHSWHPPLGQHSAPWTSV